MNWRKRVFCKKMFFILFIVPMCFVYLYLNNFVGDLSVVEQHFNNNQSINFLPPPINNESSSEIPTNSSKDEDFDRRASYPWPNDPKCSHFSVQVMQRVLKCPFLERLIESQEFI